MSRSTGNDVVVTGIGMVTPLGFDETTLWNHLLTGTTGIAPIQAFDTRDYKTKYGAEVDSQALSRALEARNLRPSDRTVDMALEASAQALTQAGLLTDLPPAEPIPAAVIVGSGTGASHSWYEASMQFADKGLRGLRPTSVPRCMANVISSQISVRFRLTGPNYVIISACTSAATAIGTGYRLIRDGYAELVLCGGTDAVFDPFVYGGWNNLGVMSTHPDPQKACRPFDTDRCGCILGEGTGMLVLESREHARRRQSRTRIRIRGYGESSDATHLTRPEPEGQARAIHAALDDADCTPDTIGYINAHATATRANDLCESQAIRLALGSAADHIPVGASKSFFGHLLGAAGAVEAIVTLLALENGLMPPNLNLDNPDPACKLCLVGSDPLPLTAPVAMTNSFGFGGNNAVLILQREENARA